MQQNVKHIFLLLLMFALSNCQTNSSITEKTINSYTDFVDPFIGTGFHGHTFPGATLPFGMVQLSPDTRLPGWDASSGYHYSDSTIYGFSHTHLSGTGIGDMGDVLLLPYTEGRKTEMLATFDKKTEQASPGYYQVYLKNQQIKAELTATMRTGMHRYTFPKDESQKVLLDLGHILQGNWGHKNVKNTAVFINDRSIQGVRFTNGWAADHRVYYHIEFSQPYKIIYISEQDEAINTPLKEIEGQALKIHLTFPENKTNELLIKVGISSVDAVGAKKNMVAENKDWDFDKIRKEAKGTWEQALQKIKIKTTNLGVKKNFYTALYHSMLAPMVAQDVDGRYRGMDKQNHQASDDFKNYTVFSLWDTFRALHPLMTIIDRKRSQEWVKALLKKKEEGGVLPKWPLASNYTGTMVGYPAVAVIADALAKDIDDFDLFLALDAVKASSVYQPELIASIPEPRAARLMPKQLKYLEKYGFIPADSVGSSVAYGLEYAYYDWCIAQIAKQARDQDLKDKYLKRSTFYKHYFDAKRGFMRAKLANGNWKEPFDPYYSDHKNSAFVEGNSWQWMWFVPHDIEGYIDLMGGKAAFEAKLDELFSASTELKGDHPAADITGLIGQYAHGNEPSHHVAYLYNFVGAYQKTQARIDEILQTLYAPTPAGISGNEDCGAMSAWYVLSALGFYQVCPGKPIYSIGRPLIDEAEIQLESGGTFKIIVENNSLENKYVKEARLNDRILKDFTFEHSEIKDDTVLRFIMEH